MNLVFRGGCELEVRTRNGRDCALLTEKQILDDRGNLYRMPVGATSDGASTPRLVWSVIPPFGPWWPAAFLHDQCFRKRLEILTTAGWTVCDFSQDESDDFINAAMFACGVDELTRAIIYKALRAFGASAFREDRAS